MKAQVEITAGQFSRIEYRQFQLSRLLQQLMKLAGFLSLPVVYPLVILARLFPESGFRTVSEFLSMVPFALGIILRYEFYRRTLRACGKNVFISFGTVFYYPEVSVGSNVLIGMYNTIHHCDFGNDVMTAEGCRFLSGSKYHNFNRTDVPMTRQGGRMRRIHVGNDVWIGANAVIMDCIEEGCVVGAGSVVTKPAGAYQVVAGNPARVVHSRR